MKREQRSPDPDPSLKKLLFVHSGSPKKRLTFEAASALGIRTFLVNPVPNWAVQFAERSYFTEGLSLKKLMDVARQLHREVRLDGVVTFWEEDVPTCALISEVLGLPGNGHVPALRARSKFRMRRAFQRVGVPVPPFALVRDGATLLQACRTVGFPSVLKPEWGSDSEWVARVDSAEEAQAVYREIRGRVRVQDCIYPYPTGQFVLEGFLSGPEVSVEGVVQGDTVHIYAIIDKAKMAEDSFIERGECTPSRLPAGVQADIHDMVRKGVRALGLTNSGIHAEIKITPEGPRIVEIGARMGGDCIHALVKRVYGIDLAEENIRVALGLPAHAPTQPTGCGISTTLVPERPGRVFFREGCERASSPHVIEVVLTKHQGDEVMVPPAGYDNVAWVSVWGKSYRGARRSLSTHVNRVQNGFVIQPITTVDGSLAHGLAPREESLTHAG